MTRPRAKNSSAPCSTHSTRNSTSNCRRKWSSRNSRGIWQQVEAEQKSTGKSFADEETTEEEQRAEYRRIAERRVRLGLVVAEVGEKAGVKVGDDEVRRAIVERARQFPGQEKLFWDYYQKNPQALAEIRAPMFEEKVVDHIIGLAKVTDKTVSKEELFKPEDEDAKA